jgi:hypothetical protein
MKKHHINFIVLLAVMFFSQNILAQTEFNKLDVEKSMDSGRRF